MALAKATTVLAIGGAALGGVYMSSKSNKDTKSKSQQSKYFHDWRRVDQKSIIDFAEVKSNDDKKDAENKQNKGAITDEPEIDDHKYGDTDDGNNDKKIGILMVGNTGTGKTSIVKFLSGQDETVIKGTDGSERGSDETMTIQSKYNKNIHFIDTVGLQDQDINWKDPELLKNTLKYLHCERLHQIKIIFCVTGDTSTRKGPFAQISTFLGDLKIEDETQPGASMANMSNITDDPMEDEKQATDCANNVWESVLIIKKGDKEGVTLDQEFIEDDFSGIFASAMDNGANKCFKDMKHVFAFACPDLDPRIKKGKRYRKCKKDEYEELSGHYMLI